MSAFFFSSIFSGLAAWAMMVHYGIDKESAGVYATGGGICLGVVAAIIEDEMKQRRQKQLRRMEEQGQRAFEEYMRRKQGG